MANEFNNAYGLTLLCPIRNGPAHGTSHANLVRAELASWGTDADSPLAAVDTTHMARLAVLDDVFYAGHPAERDHLRSRYLLVSTNFNGKLADYLELLRTRMTGAVEDVWHHCVGFPGTSDARAFSAYFQRCQIDIAIYFADYPATVAEVLDALDARRSFVDVVVATQGRDPATVRAAFTAMRNGTLIAGAVTGGAG